MVIIIVFVVAGSCMSSVAACRLHELQIYRLLQCVRVRDTAQAKKLLSAGVHDLVNITEPREGKGVLHVAAVANDTDMIEFLTLHGARPDVQDKRGRTPVMLAAELGHDGVVSLLAEKCADMKLKDMEGKGERKREKGKLWPAFRKKTFPAELCRCFPRIVLKFPLWSWCSPCLTAASAETQILQMGNIILMVKNGGGSISRRHSGTA